MISLVSAVALPLADGQSPSGGEQFTFWVCGALAVIGALGLILSRKTVHSALFTALTMINLAILYAANGAPFLALVQVIVYTGAVMMLFLFVLMLVGVDSSDSLIETLKGQRWAAGLLVLGFGLIMVIAIGVALTEATTVGIEAANAEHGGNVEGLAHLMFTKYLLPLEIVAALIISAALGALVLAHRERWQPAQGQREQQEERIQNFAAGEHPGNMPTPGVLASSNAIGTPALLPDGTPLESSIPAPIRGIQRRRLATDSDEIAADEQEVSDLNESKDTERSADLTGVTGHSDPAEVYVEDHNDEAGTGETELPGGGS